MFRRIIYLLFFLLTISSTSMGQEVSHYAFQPGEVVNYKAYYNWNFVWLHAGEVTFTIDDKNYNGLDTYHFQAKGKTLKSYEWLYKVDDHFQSYVDQNNFFPVYFERRTREGNYRVHNRYQFDNKEKFIFSKTENSDEPYNEDTLDITKPVFDVLTAIYYSRNIDYDNLEKGDKIPLPMVVDNKVYDLYIRYLGKESVKVKDNGRLNCIKFTAMLVEGTIFNKGEHLTVWVTDDKNRIPVMVEAKILVGSVKAIFKSAENLKYPSPLS